MSHMKAGQGNWWLELIAGIITVIIGYTISFNPVAGAITITTLIGISLLIVGVYNVVLSFYLK